MATLLAEFSTGFVLGVLSDKLSIEIKGIQELITQEQKRAEEQKETLERTPMPVAIVQTPDGHTYMTFEGGVNLDFEVGLSGEIIRTFLIRIVDLVTVKNTYDFWKDFVYLALVNEALFILGFFMVWELKKRTFWQTGFLRSPYVVRHPYIVCAR
jgi:hypothetical protein